jgi:hypothetical protein
MTLAHLVFAVATTAYILIAIQREERDLGGGLRHGLRRLPPAGADAVRLAAANTGNIRR